MISDLRQQLQSTLGGAYALERELGGGGMSRVFVAHEAALGRAVVVKVLPPDLAVRVSIDRFRREIRVAARLQHANIVPVLAAGEAGGLPYYTMPFVEGESLRARLAAGTLTLPEAMSVMRDVARALAHAHERGVVHRDIKPDNVLLAGGAAMVTDFGIAKALSAARTLDEATGAAVPAVASTLTGAGALLGTPAYMAPEQVAAQPDVDHRADIYAFGCMAYEMLAARTPFAEAALVDLLASQVHDQAVDVTEHRPDCPRALAALVMRCLEKDRASRPQSAGAVLEALEEVAGSTHTSGAALELAGRRALAIYAASLVAVAGVVWGATSTLGLPDWVLPGALMVMATVLPAVLFTAFVYHESRLADTQPAQTPGGSRVRPSVISALAVRLRPHVTWRRTALGGALALGAFVLAVSAALVAGARGHGPAATLFSTGTLRANDRIVVADLDVSGADSTLGGVMAEAVRSDLKQSDAVVVVPSSRVLAILRYMQRPTTGLFTTALAREVAQRDGAKAVVGGTLTRVGAGFLVSLRLIDARSGDVLASVRHTAGGPDALIESIGTSTRRLRAKIGESLKSVRGSPPLWQVTTTSVEAFEKFYAGNLAWTRQGDAPRAVALLQDAVRLDTAFAMAYAQMAMLLTNSGLQTQRRVEVAERAYALRTRLPDAERELVTAVYYDSGPHKDRAKVIEAYQRVLRASADPLVLRMASNNLGVAFQSRREYARSESLYRVASSIDTLGGLGYSNIFTALINQGKLAAAESLAAVARARIPGTPASLRPARELPYARGEVDSAIAVAEAQRRQAGPAVAAAATLALANLSLLRGRLRDWERIVTDHRARAAALGQEAPPPLVDSLTAARADAWFRGSPARALSRLDLAVRSPEWQATPLRDRPYFMAASMYALAGAPAKGRAVLARYDTEVRDTALRRFQTPDRHTVLGDLALAEWKPLDAAREFAAGDRRPDGPTNACSICTDARLGRAYDRATLADSAIARFERYLATPNFRHIEEDPWSLPGIHERLGMLYEARGDRARAIVHYARFAELWRHADPELQPRVREAKARLARLQSGGASQP